MFSAFPTSPTDLIRCQQHAGQRGTVSAFPDQLLQLSIPQPPSHGDPAGYRRNLRPTLTEKLSKGKNKIKQRQRTFPRAHNTLATLPPAPRAREGGKHLEGLPPFLLAPGARFRLPTEQQPWAKCIISLINSNMKVSTGSSLVV